ncbi:hypothetical protein AMTR_s00090p00017190, partial [Amborella trichopoda]
MEPFISDFSNSSGSEAKPVSIDGNQSTPRLTIRLKVGKKTDSQCEFGSPESVASQFDRLAGVLGHYSCKLCNLKFGSKRCLGAHVKVHASNYGFTDSDRIGLKDEHERRKDGCRGERKSTTLEKTTKHTQQEPVCALCTKKFPSMKALFGHMRCHPKRDWRGIQPPEKPVLARNNERNLQFTVVIQWKKKTEVKREARAIETAANSGTPQEGEIISNCHDSKKRKLFIGVSAANNSEEEEVSQEDVQVSGIGSEISVAFLKVSVNKRPKISRIPDNFSPERQGSHICTKCNQWFNSGQALGGHMRKHFDRKKLLAKLKAHHSSKRLMGSQVELGGERKNGGAERRNEERMGAMDLNGVMPIEDEDLKFAISMLEVVPAYAGY